MSEPPSDSTDEISWRQAAAIAGLLAERGIKTLLLKGGGTTRELRTRETDLPGVIAAMRDGEALVAEEFATTSLAGQTQTCALSSTLSLVRQGESWRVEHRDESLRKAIASMLAD